MKLTWRRALKIATDIYPKLPNRHDSLLSASVKLLAILDSFDTHTKGSSTALHEFFDSRDLESQENEHFVDLFFSSGIEALFSVRRLKFGEYQTIVEARNPELGTLYFQEWNGGTRPERSLEFWHSKGFNFNRLLDALWGKYHNRIHIGFITSQRRGRPIPHYSEIPMTNDPLLGSSVHKLRDFIQQHRRYINDVVPMAYLFVGKPGSGKTTFAMRVAEEVSGRLVRIDATGLTGLGMKNLEFLLQALQPDFLIVDDIDRAKELEAALPTMFTMLTDFKARFPKVTMIVTANDITRFDPAFLRPGRIDDIVDFEDLSVEERRAVLTGYMTEFGVFVEGLKAIVDATEGLTAAYLRHVALKLRYDTPEKVLRVVRRMQEVSKQSQSKTEGQSGPKPSQ